MSYTILKEDKKPCKECAYEEQCEYAKEHDVVQCAALFPKEQHRLYAI